MQDFWALMSPSATWVNPTPGSASALIGNVYTRGWEYWKKGEG
jgi:hypothetical protein